MFRMTCDDMWSISTISSLKGFFKFILQRFPKLSDLFRKVNKQHWILQSAAEKRREKRTKNEVPRRLPPSAGTTTSKFHHWGRAWLFWIHHRWPQWIIESFLHSLHGSPWNLILLLDVISWFMLQFLFWFNKLRKLLKFSLPPTQTATVSVAPLAFEAVVAGIKHVTVSSHPQGQISTSLPSQSHSCACFPCHPLVAALRCQPPWSAKGHQCRWALVSGYGTNIANELTLLRGTQAIK